MKSKVIKNVIKNKSNILCSEIIVEYQDAVKNNKRKPKEIKLFEFSKTFLQQCYS